VRRLSGEKRRYMGVVPSAEFESATSCSEVKFGIFSYFQRFPDIPQKPYGFKRF